MSIRTVRFNRQEETILKKVLVFYGKDFSSCVKDLMAEKLEDLKDVGFIKGIKEGSRGDYVEAGQIDKLFA